MPKRKRSSDSEVGAKLEEYEQELARALKVAKGFERQRLSKRVHSEQAQDKIQRLEREITSLKSLDLHQTAHAHLAASLTKFKSIAEHPALPDNFKQLPPRADISEEEKTALHNVTSGLYNRPNVREVVEKAIRAVCLCLEIPVPDKKAKRKKGKPTEEAQPEETIAAAEPASAKKRRLEDDTLVDDDADSEESFNGFSDVEDDDGTDGDEEDNSSIDEGDEESAIAKYESMLGGSDDDDSEGESREDLRAKYAALLGMKGDPASEDDSEDEEDDIDLAEQALGDDDSSDDEAGEASAAVESKQKAAPPPRQPSLSPSPPPTRKTKEAKAAKAGSTTFLPSLMGGYMSGSESASDVDVAPKKRLGQRQRQAIAERKHGEKANHFRKQAEKAKKGRDAGWDMRRGAVDADEQGSRGRQPWKKGGAAAGGPRGGGHQGKPAPERKKPRTSRDDQGPLHPSWEAKKKAKETQPVAFQGSKIKF